MFNSTICDSCYHCDDCSPPDSTCFYKAVWKMREQSAGSAALSELLTHGMGNPFVLTTLPRRKGSRWGFPPADLSEGQELDLENSLSPLKMAYIPCLETF